MNLLVIYGCKESFNIRAPAMEGDCLLLSFADDAAESSVRRSLTTHNITVKEVVKAGDLIDDASQIARLKFSQFMAEWPDRIQAGGKSFKRMFVHKSELSLWWLGSAAVKETEVYRSFDYLCHLEIVESLLQQQRFTGCILVGADRTFSSLIEGICQREGMGFEPLMITRGNRPQPSYLAAVAKRLGLAARTSIQLVLFKTLLKKYRDTGNQAITGFLSLYPGPLEIRDGHLYDRMYRGVIKAVAEDGVNRPLVLAWYQGRGPTSLMAMVRRGRSNEPDEGVLLLNRYLRGSDIWMTLANLWNLARFARIDRYDKSYRNSFSYHGIDVHDLLAPEIRAQFLGNEIPYHLLVAQAVERAAKDIPVSQLVCFLEMYPFARAVYFGVKRAHQETTTIAYQHANITKMRLWYTFQPDEVLPRGDANSFIDNMPVPDQYLFQGSMGMDIIKSSGYPPERCHLIGSPRYDDLGQRTRGGISGDSRDHDSQLKKIILSPSLAEPDALELLQVVVSACAGQDDWQIAVKLHPECPIEDNVQRLILVHGPEKIVLARDAVHDLIEGSDVVVTNYSTTGDEAIALGKPVICYSGLRPCMASFLDIPAAPIVHNVQEMARALQGMLYEEDYRLVYLQRRDELIEGSFYKLDGKATDRVVAALRGDWGLGSEQVPAEERMP